MTGKIIAIGNLKGGTGKTTIAVNLGAALAEGQARRVALVDADQQRSASAWVARNGLSAIDCHTLPLDTTRRAGEWLGRVRRLAANRDYVLIDLPPHVGAAMQAALAGADLVILPITPSPLDFHAAMQVLKLLDGARAARRGGRPGCLVVGSKVDRRTAIGRDIALALKELKQPVGPSIGQRSNFVTAAFIGTWVGQTAPGSQAHEEIEALAKRVRRAVH